MGLRTLMLMPRVRGPRAFGNGWPEYAHDWADLLAQQEADAEQKQRAARERRLTAGAAATGSMPEIIPTEVLAPSSALYFKSAHRGCIGPSCACRGKAAGAGPGSRSSTTWPGEAGRDGITRKQALSDST
jgi:hypothetical protein